MQPDGFSTMKTKMKTTGMQRDGDDPDGEEAVDRVGAGVARRR